jgi:hypothetical protein
MVHLLKSILTIGFGWSCPRVVVVTTTSTTAATLVLETMILIAGVARCSGASLLASDMDVSMRRRMGNGL